MACLYILLHLKLYLSLGVFNRRHTTVDYYEETVDHLHEDGAIMESTTRQRHISDPSITLKMSKAMKEPDLYQPFERTQSDAALIKEQMNRHVFKGSASLDTYDGSDPQLKSNENNQISLRSKVYMDLSCMVDREEKEEVKERKLSARRSQVLEPIPQVHI